MIVILGRTSFWGNLAVAKRVLELIFCENIRKMTFKKRFCYRLRFFREIGASVSTELRSKERYQTPLTEYYKSVISC